MTRGELRHVDRYLEELTKFASIDPKLRVLRSTEIFSNVFVMLCARFVLG